jgi:hypothetical protein
MINRNEKEQATMTDKTDNDPRIDTRPDLESGLTYRDMPRCLLVVPEITRRGGQRYERIDDKLIEGRAVEAAESRELVTHKHVANKLELQTANKIVNQAKYAFGRLGRHTPGGIVVNASKRADVEALSAKWRAEADAFNRAEPSDFGEDETRRHCSVGCYVWVFEIGDANAANLDAVIDDLKGSLDSLESAMLDIDPDGIRKVLKDSRGFASVMPEAVAERIAAARESAQAKATEISRGEKKVKRLDAKLAEELGETDPAAYAEALNQLLTGPLTGELARRAERITKLIDDKETTVNGLEVAKRKLDTSPIRAARFALLGGDAAMSEARAEAAEAPRSSGIGARIAAMSDSPRGEAAEADADAEPETESPDPDAKADADRDGEPSQPRRRMLSGGAAARFARLSGRGQ